VTPEKKEELLLKIAKYGNYLWSGGSWNATEKGFAKELKSAGDFVYDEIEKLLEEEVESERRS